MPITVINTDDVAIMNLGDDENRFSLGFLDDIDGHLEDVASSGAGGVTAAAVGMLAGLGGKDPGTLGAIKNTMYGPAIAALTRSRD